MWRVYKAAGRPWPVFSHDPVADYMLMEAVAIKSARVEREEQERAEKNAEREKFKKDFSELNESRGG